MEEKKVICFVLLTFALGLVTKEYREKHPPPTPPAVKASATGKRNSVAGKSPRAKETKTEKESHQ
jgi:hypothetical protein